MRDSLIQMLLSGAGAVGDLLFLGRRRGLRDSLPLRSRGRLSRTIRARFGLAV
jgi:hypothetical protein